MRGRNAAALLGAALILGACAAGEAGRHAALSAPEPQPDEPAELSGPGLPLLMAMPIGEARESLERVAASCWLDDVVGGGSMIVDRATGRVVITSDTEDLLITELVPLDQNSSIAQVTGPAIDDPATVLRLSETLEAWIASGQTECRVDA